MCTSFWAEYESCPALEKLDDKKDDPSLYKLEVGKHDPAFDHLANRLQTHFKKVYPDLFKRFVDPCRAEGKQEIHLEIDPDQQIPARIREDGKHIVVVLGPKHFGPDAVQAEGVITRALASIVQDYPKQPGDAAWLMQGMADYARHTYGLEDDPWSLLRPKRGDVYYDKDSRVAARFLVWLEKKKSDHIVDDLNDRLQRGTFTLDTFQQVTGQSADELWEEYERCPTWEKLDSHMYNPTLYKLEVGEHDPAFDHLVKRVQTHFKKVYPDLFKRFVDPCRADKVIHLEIDPDHGSPASIDGNRIILGPKHLGPDAVQAEGVMTRALASIVQDYPKQSGDAAWLVKGMADYARHTYGPKNDTWALPRLEQGHKYTDGNGVAASFLIWLEKNKGNHIVDNLNRLLQSGHFTVPDFFRLTRQTVDELWEEYHSNQLAKQELANQPSEDRMDFVKTSTKARVTACVVLGTFFGYYLYRNRAKKPDRAEGREGVGEVN